MKKEESLEILKQALLITQDMQDKAHTESWEDIIPLERQRQRLLDTVFPIEQADDRLREILEMIVKLNNTIEHQCREAKGELQKQLTDMNKNKRAMSAYLIP